MVHVSGPRGVRPWGLLLLVGYVGAVGWVLLQPRPTVAVASVGEFSDLLARLGVDAARSDWIPEFVVNALVFVPVPVLGVLALRGTTGAGWAVACYLGSVGVEGVQALALPERSAQFVDIVANTLGAVVGCLVVVAAQMSVQDPRNLESSALVGHRKDR